MPRYTVNFKSGQPAPMLPVLCVSGIPARDAYAALARFRSTGMTHEIVSVVNERTGEPELSLERFEAMLRIYEVAIERRNLFVIEQLVPRVELMADAIGYTNHGRLKALHTAAERAAHPELY